MAPVVNIAGGSPGTKIALSLMHVIAAVAIVGALVRGLRRDSPAVPRVIEA